MVWQIMSVLAVEESIEDILAEYSQIAREDIQACLAYAAETTQERVLPSKSPLMRFNLDENLSPSLGGPAGGRRA